MAEPKVIIDGCNPSNWDEPNIFDNLVRGGVTASNATIAIWETFEETMDIVARWIRRFRSEKDVVTHVRTAADILELADTPERTGIILGWQNLSPIGHDTARLELFADLGVRIVQLAYNFRNLAANGCYERADDGLSTFGVDAIKVMNERGILVDLSHVGDRSCYEAIEVSESPVAITHANLREFYDHPRNKPEALVRWLVEHDGVIGANAFPTFLPYQYEATVREYLDAIESLVEVAGIDHVGLGTDFCEGRDQAFWSYLNRIYGRVEDPDRKITPPVDNPVVAGFESAAEFPLLAQHLRDRGFSEDDVQKLMGGNWLRLFERVWK